MSLITFALLGLLVVDFVEALTCQIKQKLFNKFMILYLLVQLL